MATHSSILAWRLSMDRAAWWATVHGVVKGQIQLERLNNNNDDRQLQGDPLIPYPEPANFTDLSED